jgi:hypothetical protein
MPLTALEVKRLIAILRNNYKDYNDHVLADELTVARSGK